MNNLSAKPVRVNVSAAIVRDHEILLAVFDDSVSGIHYNLPGGGVDPGESLREAALREAWEETGAHIMVGRLLLIWEYIPAQQRYKYGTRQKISFCFRAELMPESEPRYPNMPDTDQVGIRWLPLAELPSAPLLPQIALPLIAALNRPAGDDGPDLIISDEL